MYWMRSRKRCENPVARTKRPVVPAHSTPNSADSVRSGRSAAFPTVNPSAKFSKKLGALKAEPAEARSRTPSVRRHEVPARTVWKVPKALLSSRRAPRL